MTSAIRFRIPIVAVLVVAAAGVVAGKKSEVNTSRGQLALRGYDAVAYSTDGKPRSGTTTFEYRWNGVRSRFATAANRDRFAKEPERYVPEFGGYCAYAVSCGYTADGDPTVWRIVDGGLYLNYSRHAQTLWEEDAPGNIAKGRRNWPAVLEK